MAGKRISKKPGPWSMAMADWARPLVAKYPGRQEAFGPANGISEGKLSKLLRGVSPWTLEDVSAVCHGLGFDPEVVLLQVSEVQPPPVALMSVPAATLAHVDRDDLDAVADGSPDEDALRAERGEWPE